MLSKLRKEYWFPSMSIQTILVLSMSVLLLLLLGSSDILMTRYMARNIESLSHQQFSLLADIIRLHILDLKEAGTTMEVLDSTFTKLRQMHPEIFDLRFIRDKAVIREYGFSKHEQAGDRNEIGKLTGDQPTGVIKQVNNHDVIHYLYPFKATRECISCHDVIRGERLGVLSLSLDFSQIEVNIKNSNQVLLMIHLVEIILIIFLLICLIHYLIFRRLRTLHRGIDRFTNGDMSTYVVGESDDETGIIVRSFNQMTRQIKELVEERDEKIREQANDLTFLHEMSENMESSQVITEVMQQFSKAITESIKVTCCRIAILDEGKQILTIKAGYPLHYLPQALNEGSAYYKINCPRLWQVIETQKQLLIHKGDQVSDCERDLMLLDRAKSVLCIPLLGKKVLGLVILIELRAETREPITQEKMLYCSTLTRQLAARIENGYLQERLIEYTKEATMAMAETVDKKSTWTAGHSRRVTDLAISIGKGIGLNEDQLQDLYTAGLLHDIGKIGTPGTILNKSGKLSTEEREIINRHPDDGAQILSKMKQFTPILPAVRHHHERFDGNGYPDGLKGEDIPLAARVLAVADTYDAMTSDRPYRKGLSHDKALSLIQEEKGKQFDPQVVDAFVHCATSMSFISQYSKVKTASELNNH